MAIKKKKSDREPGNWFVYILKCRGGRLYTGITNNLEKRVAAHRAGRGAKFTRAFGPVRLAWSQGGYTHSAAARREAAVKKLPRSEKAALLPAVKPRPPKK
ncbi:MAG TPA: GIY-YIG nuclease family protein [Elusimicrobiales bacterium]|nr:GIY-YIG nuclease family protein [Elusimicrobiales bacterium]